MRIPDPRATLFPMTERYRVRAEPHGHTVYDYWTGEAVILAMVAQTELALPDAMEVAALMNRRARSGERTVFQ